MSDNGTDVLRWEPAAVRPGWIGRQGTGRPSSSPWHAHTSLGSRVGQPQDPREPLPRPAPLPKPRTEHRAAFPLPWALVLQLLEVCGCLTLEPQDLGWDGEGGGQPRKGRRGVPGHPGCCQHPKGRGPTLASLRLLGPHARRGQSTLCEMILSETGTCAGIQGAVEPSEDSVTEADMLWRVGSPEPGGPAAPRGVLLGRGPRAGPGPPPRFWAHSAGWGGVSVCF